MISEHAICWSGAIDISQLEYVIEKANRLGLDKRQIYKVRIEKEGNETHLFFDVDELKSKPEQN